jgi:FtsP/CotA-like multicopper oxidase with cupredoxin domain
MYENELPFTGLRVINRPASVKIQVEKRKVKLANGVVPSQENAWIYRSVSSPNQPGLTVRNNYLGPIINVEKGTPCNVRWINALSAMTGMPEIQEAPPINPPMNMVPGMQPAVGIVTHLHGAKVPPQYDGWPLTPVGYPGNPYNFPSQRQYVYPNDQRAAMLWFHDHSMDNTAPQVHAGLAGLYFIRDQSDVDIFALLGGVDKEIPLVIQDRNLACGYDRMDYWGGLPSDQVNVDPINYPDGYARPEFLGETIFVNGRATPFHNVDRSIYRLRILNGSNARTYALALIDPFWWAKDMAGSRVWYSDCLRVIGNDGGLFTQSVALNKTDYLLIAPGERLDVLLDLTGATLDMIECLRLVNLAIPSTILGNDTGLEGIFQSEQLSVLKPANESDASLNNTLKLGQANIMQFCISQQPSDPPLNAAALDNILLSNTDDDNFVLNNGILGTKPPMQAVVRNRFVLLMNGTDPNTPNPFGTAWRDVQMWELGAPDGVAPTWNVPFNVDTAGNNQVAGVPSAQTGYGVFRSTFFQADPPPIITPTTGYPALHPPTIQPKSGAYERWYVANIGNDQSNPMQNPTVDMHPFHIHLVNFVVTGRWTLDGAGNFTPSLHNVLNFDGISRHDTVRVESNELVELLVYFPLGYTGDYVYHCHLVEHEDMGMMLHFSVQP